MHSRSYLSIQRPNKRRGWTQSQLAGESARNAHPQVFGHILFSHVQEGSRIVRVQSVPQKIEFDAAEFKYMSGVFVLVPSSVSPWKVPLGVDEFIQCCIYEIVCMVGFSVHSEQPFKGLSHHHHRRHERLCCLHDSSCGDALHKHVLVPKAEEIGFLYAKVFLHQILKGVGAGVALPPELNSRAAAIQPVSRKSTRAFPRQGSRHHCYQL
mmetsp:Transcript_78656/g.127590  ORF Transcript_78656/g.127590 Transcript_78656/m.127590 type:complete len:210 (-) Transcript_78656:221-850(-)